jgi:outer membrane lipoprotein-sorting protein
LLPAHQASTLALRREELKMMKFAKACGLAVGLSLALLGPVGTSLVPAAVHAAKPAGIAVTPEVKAAIDRVNAYFNSFQTMTGDLVQTTPRGRTAKGVFFISKPGKLRFEVEPPTPYILAADGRWLTFTNKKMDRGDQLPLSKTPLRLLVTSKLDLLQEVVVVNYQQADGFTTLALADKKGLMSGQIILVFDDSTNELRQWVIVDGKGLRTTVDLSNLAKDVKINPKLFNVKIRRKN